MTDASGVTPAAAGQSPEDPKALGLAVEVIPRKLYFASLGTHPESTATRRYFTIDYDLVYEPFFADFGPLHIGHLVAFCRAMKYQLDQTGPGVEILFYTSHNGHKRANAGCLIACFCVAVLRMSPADTWRKFERAYPPFLSFRDASYGVSTFSLGIYDVLCGLQKALQLQWFDVDTFDLEKYTYQAEVSNGDWHWIVPRQFVAFSSPHDEEDGREARRLIRQFRENNVQLVVRLNEKLYDRRTFTEVGIRHLELPFPDGSIPSDSVTRDFLAAAERQVGSGAIAVHCKQGVGRTGTMIGLYVMKHFGFSAKEYIGWARLCRPGCVVGPQQQFLQSMERRFAAYLRAHSASLPFVGPSEAWRQKAQAEDVLYGLATPRAPLGSNAPADRLVPARAPELPFGPGRPPLTEADFKYTSSRRLHREAKDMQRHRAKQEASAAARGGTIRGVLGNASRPGTVDSGIQSMLRVPAVVGALASGFASARSRPPTAIGAPLDVLSDLLPDPKSHVATLYKFSRAVDGNQSASLPSLRTMSGTRPARLAEETIATEAGTERVAYLGAGGAFTRPTALFRSALEPPPARRGAPLERVSVT